MSNLETMTEESAVVLRIVAQMSSLPDYHDIARSMLARLANRSSNILVGKPDWKKAGRPPRYTRESLIAALTAAGGNAKVAAGNLGITYKSLRNTCHDHAVVITEVQKAIASPAVEQPAAIAVVQPATPPKANRRLETEARWTRSRRDELIDLWNRRPLLSNDEIGKMTGRTASAIQTAASRFGLPRRLTHSGGEGSRQTKVLPVPVGGGMKPCITCTKTFWSEHKHNRMCAKCTSDDDLSASAA